MPKHLVFSFVFGSLKDCFCFLEKTLFLIFGPDFNVLCSLLPDVSCQCKGFGDVHCDEYCQLSDAKSKVHKFH